MAETARLLDLAHHAIKAGAREQALHILTQLLIADPECAPAWADRGAMLQMLGHPFDALLNFDRGLALSPSTALHNNRGAALMALGRYEDAQSAFFRAILCDLDFDRAHINYGLACRRLGQWDAALEAFRRALAISPRDAEIHYNIGHMCLALGQWAEGWDEFAWWRKIESSAAYGRPTGAKEWNGQPGARHILIRDDAGFGDAIQFLRFVPLIHDKIVPHVTLALRRQLMHLAEANTDVGVIPIDSPEADADITHVAGLMDLPRICRARPGDVPNKPYLRVADEECLTWRGRFSGLDGRKIGLCWAGGRRELMPYHAAMDAERSIPLAMLKPLFDVPGTSFVALQKDDADRPPLNGSMLDPMEEVIDFYDTAALISELDLVISVDTAVAHIAGALGKPVWLLNRFDSCWRWGYDRADSPWYPSMRIFRQPQPGNWGSVVETVAAALAAEMET